jgi:hypothetical protein
MFYILRALLLEELYSESDNAFADAGVSSGKLRQQRLS